MRLWPIVIDYRPSYLHGRLTLLSMPLGTTTVFDHVRSTLNGLCESRLTIIPPRDVDIREYQKHVDALSAGTADICAPPAFADLVARHELSDALLILDTRSFLMEKSDVARLVGYHAAEPRLVHHLVQFDSDPSGLRERVSLDETGLVRGIRRHYEMLTWPVISFVSATILPLGAGIDGERFVLDRLSDLRRAVAVLGMPSRDVPLRGTMFDFTREQEFLGANERVISAHAAGVSRRGHICIRVGTGQSVHRTARVIPPVAVHAGAVIEEFATVIGPAVIGAGARVASGAYVSLAVVAPGCAVPPESAVHDCLWVEGRRHAGAETKRAPAVRTDAASTWGRTQHRQLLPPQPSPLAYLPLKRALDIALVSMGLIFVLPLMLLAAAFIVWQGDGPIFYGDKREGQNGRPFRCWKFRTMTSGAHSVQKTLSEQAQVDGPHFKMARDPRVTRLGRILRATNVDELPQLWNVLRGQMSLVGPRPSPFRENQICVPWREARISVPPGITGLWQVCRHDRSAGDFHQWIEYDLLYVQHLSLLLDIKILAGTLLTLGGKLTHFRPETLIGRTVRDEMQVQEASV